ncbi:MAG: hypothetical protein ACLR4Z_06810 [Butyricicoccaceae bacterium]
MGSYKPESIDNLLISIQTFNSQKASRKRRRRFLTITSSVEFHHAAAPTHRRSLFSDITQLRILPGLTATS